MKSNHKYRILRDIGIVFLSIILAMMLVKTNTFADILKSTQEVKVLGSFIAGIFFTSIFTTPISMVALGEMALTTPPWVVALFGALGALVGDLLLFWFVRKELSDTVTDILKIGKKNRRIKHLLKMPVFRWLTPLLGALVIASPLPDELGIAMMGLSKMKSSLLIPISLSMNFIGILIIALIARSLV